MLTYNVWFEQIVAERLDAVLDTIERADADVICLQEMTWEIWAHFEKNAYI